MKIRTEFKMWAVAYFMAPFSWSKWTNIALLTHSQTK